MLTNEHEDAQFYLLKLSWFECLIKTKAEQSNCIILLITWDCWRRPLVAISLANYSKLPISEPKTIVQTKETNAFIKMFRIYCVIFHTFTGFFIAGLLLPLVSKPKKKHLIKWWCKKLLGSFNIKIIITGDIPRADLTHAMIISNHISWADIHVLNSVLPLRFIAKSDIRHWPIFGFFASRVDTLFVDRAKKQDALKVIDITTACLQAGDRLCLFPEGTTTDGTCVLTFKSSLIEAAIRANTAIYPVAIRYPLLDDSPNTAMAYAGETTLMQAMGQALTIKKPVVAVHFFAPIMPKDQDRRALATLTREIIVQHLNL